jgi:16S rRNA processing protein RimM
MTIPQSDSERRSGEATPSSSLPAAAGQESAVTHLVIGQVVGPRGLRGELKVRIESEDPERFCELERVYLGDEQREFTVRRARLFKEQALLQLVGIEDRDAAAHWQWAWVYVHLDDALPLAEGQFYLHQLLGLAVRTEEGEELGTLEDILETGANDVYVVRGQGDELLLPAIPQVVRQVDMDARTITVRLLPGLR